MQAGIIACTLLATDSVSIARFPSCEQVREDKSSTVSRSRKCARNRIDTWVASFETRSVARVGRSADSYFLFFLFFHSPPFFFSATENSPTNRAQRSYREVAHFLAFGSVTGRRARYRAVVRKWGQRCSDRPRGPSS